LLKSIIQWRISAGRIESIDLRFDGEAVVNPGLSATAKPPQSTPPPAHLTPAAAAKTKVTPPLAAQKPPKRAKGNAKAKAH